MRRVILLVTVLSGGSSVPSNAIRDRAANVIRDRAASIIVTRS